ncbi:hypothetical protein [Methyloradius palustris]|uniref:Uncharacterized protein n=1 Tax=Methyloradius palustris TaxID=2778876 RepID=A0A8D5GC11_9PROT|nr:hypothetical protein [Methyloradius palustris]BCM23769.1 hypothetical protein ZMTM_00280 [Methyloradius palustris]
MKKYLSMLLLLMLNGCGGYSIHNIDKPPPEDYDTWKKQGESQLRIKKTLLECGAIAPSTLGWSYMKAYEKIGLINQKDQTNHGFLVDRCMLKAGFVQQNTSWTIQDACADPRYRDYPACQPDTIIPAPSFEKRLNGWYCKVKTNYDFCLKYSLNVSGCSPERASNPPPECLDSNQSPSSSIGSNGSTDKQYKNNLSPLNPDSDKAIRLQRDIRNQSNQQMNEMLRNRAPRIGR